MNHREWNAFKKAAEHKHYGTFHLRCAKPFKTSIATYNQVVYIQCSDLLMWYELICPNLLKYLNDWGVDYLHIKVQ